MQLSTHRGNASGDAVGDMAPDGGGGGGALGSAAEGGSGTSHRPQVRRHALAAMGTTLHSMGVTSRYA